MTRVHLLASPLSLYEASFFAAALGFEDGVFVLIFAFVAVERRSIYLNRERDTKSLSASTKLLPNGLRDVETSWWQH